MTPEELSQWAEAYICAQDQAADCQPDGDLHWAIQKFFDLEYTEPEICWQAILHILRKQPSKQVKAMLAAGPLEDLIENFGPQFIDRIEAEARTNPEFRQLLSGVWESGHAEIWVRVLKARNSQA
jgi:hypothetical protein